MSLVSLYDEASLWMTPGAYEDGKLLSELPTDGSGDFTFSRGSNLAATRVDANGLIEKGRENVFTYSQDFRDASGWLVLNATKASITETDPNGGATAANITWTAGSGRYFFKNIASGNVLTTSFYVKSNGGGNKFRLFGDGATDLSQDFTATSEWQRFEFFFERGSGQGVGITNASDNSAADLLVAFAQLEQGLVATDYIETGASTAQAGVLEDEPRLDYSGGASCPSLLLEPQRTNALVNSEYFPSWNTNEVTLYSGYSAPDGTNSAYKITKDGTQSYVLIPGNSTSSDARSIYARTTSGTGQVNLTSHNSNTNSLFTITEEWKRFDVTSTPNIAANYYAVDFRAGDLDEIIIWGAQQEVGSYPTSYIPTYGTSQTRLADKCVKTGISSLIGQTEGTIYLEADIQKHNEAGFYIAISDGAQLGNALYVYQPSSGTLTVLARKTGNPYDGVIQVTSPNWTAGINKLAIAYTSTTAEFFINGFSKGTTIFPSLASFTNLTIGSRPDGVGQLVGTGGYKQAVLFPTALNDSECIALTKLD